MAEILPILEPHGVVGIRKLFSDPIKAKVPLYVLTFIGIRPSSITIGYTRYTIDQHIPNPMRCGNCCRWGHTTSKCRSPLTCGRCAARGHKHTECTAATICCPNCKESHEVNSKSWPHYLLEIEACRLQAAHNIGFPEARRRARNTNPTEDFPLSRSLVPTPNCAQFPLLPPKTGSRYLNHNSSTPDARSYSQAASSQPTHHQKGNNTHEALAQPNRRGKPLNNRCSPDVPPPGSTLIQQSPIRYSQLPSSFSTSSTSPASEYIQPWQSQRVPDTYEDLPCNQEQLGQTVRNAYTELNLTSSPHSTQCTTIPKITGASPDPGYLH